MDRIIDNEIQNLLEEGIGDSGRLEFIRTSLQGDKKLYNTDRIFLCKLLEKHSQIEDISERLDYLNPTLQKITLLEKPKTKQKKTSIKILIIIGISISAYILTHPILIRFCNAISEDISECSLVSDLFSFTALTITMPYVWDTRIGMGTWEGTIDGIEIGAFFTIEENLVFLFLFVVIPLIAILGVILHDKKTIKN